MTLLDFKNQVAQQYGWESFQELKDDHEYRRILDISTEAAELYAQSQVNEAYDSVLELLRSTYPYDVSSKVLTEQIEELKLLKR